MNKLMLNPLRAAVLLSLVAAGQAQANQLEEIVVTAQKRSESLAEVPISISVVTGTQIEDQGLANLEALSYSIPNLKITQTSIANRIAIRGIASGDNKGFEQSVAMFVDGIYYGRDQLSRMPLVDLQRVEVLKGPQPTLFGKNAIAGAVSVISRQPSDEFEASVDALYEVEHEEMVLTGVVSGPVNDALGLRLVARYRGMDGYFDNTTQERMEPNVEESFVRGTMTWQSGDVTGSLKLENANFDVEGQPRETFNPVGTYSLIFQGPLFVDTVEDYKRQDNGYESQNQVTNAVLTLEMPLGENTLTSISGFLKYEVDELIDVDFSRLNLLDGTNQQEEYRQYSQELRITSPDGGDFNYITGLYLQRSELTADDTVVFNPFFFAFGLPFAALGNTFNVRDYEQESSLWSVFAQA
ncbi:MAG: TonB-dependent receptor, partial [Steroidobacteraceae bacterium]